MAFRAALGALGAMWAAQLLALPHPLFSLISAVIVTDLAAKRTRELGRLRVIATVFGSLVGLVLGMVFVVRPFVVAIGVAIAMLACTLARAAESAKIAGFVAAIVLMTDESDPLRFAIVRLIETVVGIAVAWMIALVPPLFDTAPPDNKNEPSQQ